LSEGSLVFGVEPDEKLIEIAELKRRYFGLEGTFFLRGVCENLPYRSGVFDVVICKTVLEHVKDIKACISEMKRVLGDGGLIYIEAPNYVWLYEGHYQLPFLPLMPKPLFRLYARLLGKDPSFINHINYLTPRMLKDIIRREGMEVRDLSMRKLHAILVERDLTHLPERLGPLKPLLSFFYCLGVGKLCFMFMRAVGLHPNIILVALKK
jgi:SAM-dependent methyltransferase